MGLIMAGLAAIYYRDHLWIAIGDTISAPFPISPAPFATLGHPAAALRELRKTPGHAQCCGGM